jgi:glutamyl-tRNA reductase
VHILTVGINHKTAPVEVRERLAFPASSLGAALRALTHRDGLTEAAILSTCNRAEIYTVAVEPERGVAETCRFLSEFHDVCDADFKPHLYQFHNGDAARHLFSVACGLDSLVLGESQILGQVREAFTIAQQNGAARLLLDELFRRSLNVGKRARTETDIGKGALSVSSAAVELAKQMFGHLRGRSVLILGAGKMGELTARHLVDNGVATVWVANRTPSRAVQMAEKFGGTAVPYEQFLDQMVKADIVISSTSAPTFILNAENLAPVMRRRRGWPLFLIDIAVPRDVDPDVRRLDNVFMFDIDDLEHVVAENRAERGKEVRKVEVMIEAEARDFLHWLNSLGTKPLITALRQHTEELQQAEMEKWLRKMPHLSDRDRDLIQAMMRGFANKMLHDPLTHIREFASQSDGYLHLETVRRLYNLDVTASSDSEIRNPKSEIRNEEEP